MPLTSTQCRPPCTLQFGWALPARQVPGVSSRSYAQPATVGSGAGSGAAEPAGPVSPLGSAPAEAQGRVIERRTFARTFPSRRSVWRQLTASVQLQEACFQDVVLLYRPEAAPAAAAEAAVARRCRLRGGSDAAPASQHLEGELSSVEDSVGGDAEEVRRRWLSAGVGCRKAQL